MRTNRRVVMAGWNQEGKVTGKDHALAERIDAL
jgi:hypothetical protein